MRVVLHGLLLALLLLCVPGIPAQQDAIDPARRARRELLVSHGVDPNPTSLVRFLNEGFFTELPAGLPAEPVMKSEVLNAAIIEVGMQKVEAAVPVLRKIARRERVDSVQMIVSRDLEREPMEVRDRTWASLERFFSLNAVTSLGWIGDPSGGPAVLDVMRTESGTAFVTKGAVALAMMGSPEGLGSLVILASDEKNLDCISAFEAVWFITGRNYGVHQWTSLARRRAAIKELRAWFEAEGATAPVYRAEVIRRMQSPVRWDTAEPGSLRELLRASRDLDDYDRRFYARERLKSVAQGKFDILLSISNDKMEDVDIRLAAMQYLSALDPKKARRHINRLEKDENQPVSEIAKSLDVDIERAIEAAKKKKKS